MKKLFYVFIASAIVMSSCKKGDVGPAGNDGNANVKSYTLTVKPVDWMLVFGKNVAYVSLPAITDSVLNHGAVDVYFKSGSAWCGLPILGYSYAFNRTTTNPNYIAITFDNAIAPTSDVIFRAVVIQGLPGSIALLKKMTFEQLDNMYNLGN